MTYRLDVVPAGEWPAYVAGELAAELRAAPDLRLCLPTGDTPAPAYAAMAELAARSEMSLARATVVLLDDYLGLPPGDPAAGEQRLRRELLDRVPAGSFHAVPVDAADLDEAVARHDAAAAGLDLALIGIGLNGHVGFNEPGSGPETATRVVELAQSSREVATGRYGALRVPTRGITIGMRRLLQAGAVWLLVSGERKSDVLRRALEEPESVECPASFLRRHPRLRVFADEPASAALRAPRSGAPGR